MKTSHRRLRPGILTSVAAGAMAMTSGAAAQPTAVEELVMYGIDADTHELVRYTFDTDTFVRIGVVVDQFGFTIDHPECLTYVPSGPHRGFYAVPNGKDGTGGAEHTLAKINAMDGSCFMYPTPVGQTQIRSMVSVQNPVTGDWVIVAYSRDPVESLIAIDPATGLGTKIVELDTEKEMEGLALHPDPDKLYAIKKNAFMEIDVNTGVVTQVRDLSEWERMEALESAFGDNGPAIDIPGVDASWTANGALFAFSDSEDALLVLNPATGETEQYSCSYETIDTEGLVFFTQMTDPYGKILVDPHD
ncbi:MAG: hypothetical protein ACYS15_03840 [Planctomycetota bacterium]